MSSNPKHIARPATPAAKPLTKEEQAAQIARFFSQKRESLFQLILANLLQNIAHVDALAADLKPVVDAALNAADYAIEKLYPLPKEGEAE
jgi:hypothetical protein